MRCVNAELIFGSGCFPEIRRSGAECLMELDAADGCEVEGAEGIHLVLFKLLHPSFHFHSLPHWEHLMIPKLGPSFFPSFRFQLNTCPPALYLVTNSSKARSSLCSLVISPGWNYAGPKRKVHFPSMHFQVLCWFWGVYFFKNTVQLPGFWSTDPIVDRGKPPTPQLIGRCDAQSIGT